MEQCPKCGGAPTSSYRARGAPERFFCADGHTWLVIERDTGSNHRVEYAQEPEWKPLELPQGDRRRLEVWPTLPPFEFEIRRG